MAFSPNRAEPREKIEKVSAQRMRLWTALNAFVHSQGGWVVSAPYGRFVRIEVEQGSSLPVHWRKLATGYITPE
jgi:hypothetical protein